MLCFPIFTSVHGTWSNELRFLCIYTHTCIYLVTYLLTYLVTYLLSCVVEKSIERIETNWHRCFSTVALNVLYIERRSSCEALTRRSYTRRHLWQPGYVTKPNTRRGVVLGVFLENGRKLFNRAAFCIPKHIYDPVRHRGQLGRICVQSGIEWGENVRSLYTSFHIIQAERTEITRGVSIGRGERRPSRPRARLGTGLLKGRATKLGYELRHTDTARRESRDAMQGLCFFSPLPVRENARFRHVS